MNNNDTAILIFSCDKYSDIWKPFFHCFFKYFPGNSYPVYLGTNFLNFQHHKVVTVNSNLSKDWSSEARVILDKIKEKYLIVLLEDYLIYKPVDKALLDKCVLFVKENNPLFLRIASFPSKYTHEWWQYDILPNKLYGEIKGNQKYRISLQAGIWDREKLINIVKQGESPHEFEIEGSKRAEKYKCYCLAEDKDKNYVHGPITYLCTAITKGIWMREALMLAKKEKINLNITDRKIETYTDYLYRKIYIMSPFFFRKALDFIKINVKSNIKICFK